MIARRGVTTRGDNIAVGGLPLLVVGLVGRVCGPVARLEFLAVDQRLVIVRVLPSRGVDPILCIPAVAAAAEAWRGYAAFFRAVLRLMEWPSPSAHQEALERLVQVAAAFEPYLSSTEGVAFSHWLGVTMLGDVTFTHPHAGPQA